MASRGAAQGELTEELNPWAWIVDGLLAMLVQVERGLRPHYCHSEAVLKDSREGKPL